MAVRIYPNHFSASKPEITNNRDLIPAEEAFLVQSRPSLRARIVDSLDQFKWNHPLTYKTAKAIAIAAIVFGGLTAAGAILSSFNGAANFTSNMNQSLTLNSIIVGSALGGYGLVKFGNVFCRAINAPD